MMRQFLFDAWHLLPAGGADALDRRAHRRQSPRRRSRKSTYHLRRSGDLVVRLGDGTDESHAKTQAAVDELWMYTRRDVHRRRGRRRAGRRRAWRRPPRGAARSLGSSTSREIFADSDADDAARPTPGCSRAASRAAHTEHLGYCWPRCSSCSAPIPERSGDGAMQRCAVTAEQVWDLARRGRDPEIPVISIVDLGIVRDVEWRRTAGAMRRHDHADLFGLPGDRR